MPFSLRKRQRESRVPIDSFSDIAFLLIIFFILTTSIRRLTGFNTELPAGDKSATPTTEKTPTVGLQVDRVLFNDSPVSLEELKTQLLARKFASRPPGDRVVLLDAGAEVVYQVYFEVMSIITAADGVVGILSEEEGK
ncbi:MAG: biopolymer transporter ExbD [Lentisphaerae bacterium]|nr:biopolymer transporter ExbD [Lentisphaerota bacterium]